jgi:endogenous inhibitor of DNA gyrase (YacG/DUF329 family)
MTQKCIACGKEITTIDRVLKLFWAPVGCNISFVYKFVCSKRCWEIALYQGLKNPDELISKIKRSLV